MSKRELAARVLGQPLLSRWRQTPRALRILAYHRVIAPPWDDFAFDEALISASPEDFERQMRWVKRDFEVVSFGDLDACDRESRVWPARSLVVTFDDGYRDNFEVAFPILRELNLPATIFLATGHIGAQKLFWWDAIAWCFKKTEYATVQIPEIGAQKWVLTSPAEKRAAIEAVLAYAKTASENARREFVEKLSDVLGLEMPAEIAQKMHLNWDEVRAMAQNKIEFGSHTVTHPILSQVDEKQLRFEACQSKSDIERATGREVLAFAYPAGTRARRSESARAMIEKCGYRFAVAYDQNIGSADRFALPRLHVDRDQSLELLRANAFFPNLMLRA